MTSRGGFLVQIATVARETAGVGCYLGDADVVTCAHVVNAALGRELRSREVPDDEVTLRFPLLDENAWRQARVVLWLPPTQTDQPGADLAVLRIQWRVPAGATPIGLASGTPTVGRIADVFGYPGVPPRPDGSWVSATVRGVVGGGRLQLDSDVAAALRVQPGFSGSPVVDRETEELLGLLVAAPAGSSSERDSYAISVDQVRSLLGSRAVGTTPMVGGRPVTSRTLPMHRGPVTAVACADRSSLVATADAAGTVQIWRGDRGVPGPVLRHSARVATMAFHPTEDLLAVGGEDGAVALWDVESGRTVARLEHVGPLSSLAFSSDGRSLAVGGNHGTVTVWDVETRVRDLVMESGHPVVALAFSSQGSMLAVHGTNDVVALADTEQRSSEGSVRIDNLGGGIVSAALSAVRRDGLLGVTGDKQGTLRFWRLDKAFHPRAHIWFSVSGADHTVVFYDDRDGRHTAAMEPRIELASIPAHADAVTAVAFHVGGEVLVTGSRDGSVRLWAFGAAALDAVTRLSGHVGAVTVLAFAADGRTLATGGDDGAVRLWDPVTAANFEVLFTEHGTAVGSVAFVIAGEMVVVGTPDGPLRMHALRRRSVYTLELSEESWGVAFGPEEGGEDGEGETSAPMSPMHGNMSRVEILAFSPDGRTAAMAAGTYTALLDLADGRQHEFPQAQSQVHALAFSPDGETLAIVFEDGFRLEPVQGALGSDSDTSLPVWGNAGGAATVVHHLHTRNPAAFSPDGRTLAIGAADGTVRRWDVATRQVGSLHTAHAGAVTAVTFSPDGLLATADEDGMVYLWHSG
ncbi:trypsin-like peptidase domain-containing protein [Catenulispora subtropica]|uniref:Anaphase-promoting complex subunit 4-like WD40 domain-containing protein n=1 Tax=Catenulispora subtropica TaxID=450798 RepID=A0ABN2QSD8_9ACTN